MAGDYGICTYGRASRHGWPVTPANKSVSKPCSLKIEFYRGERRPIQRERRASPFTDPDLDRIDEDVAPPIAKLPERRLFSIPPSRLAVNNT